MTRSILQQYPAYLRIIIIFLLGLNFSGCSSIEVKNTSNYLPASVFRSDVKNVLSAYYGNEQILERSIFRPQFLHYLNTIYHTNGPVEINQVKNAIATWNSIMTGGNDQISFNALHFYRLAALSNNNPIECNETSDCVITDKAINLVQKWHQHKTENIASTKLDSPNANFRNVDYPGDPALKQALINISTDPIGHKLVRYCSETGVNFVVQKLHGKHAYYNHWENSIVIDPKVLTYEFNLRYLIHEMVHATNRSNDNSITEEVLAELIGLDIQNRITDIPMELQPYSVFIQHLLHPEYGKLPLSNNIIQSLSDAGLKI